MFESIKKFITKVLNMISFCAGALSLLFGAICLSLDDYPTVSIICAIYFFFWGIACIAFATRSRWYEKHYLPWKKKREAKRLQDIRSSDLSPSDEQHEITDFIQECYQKAVADYNKLNDVIRELHDTALITQLQKMQDIARKMLLYMKQHPERITLAEHFINYYQDKALLLSQQFLEFEKMELNTPEINELKAKTKHTLESFDEAYETEFSRMVSNKIMEIESELKVAQQIMSDAGITNTSPRSDDMPGTSSAAASKNNPFAVERPFDTQQEPVAEAAEPSAGHPHRPFGRFQH